MNVLSLVSYNFLPATMGGQKHIALHNEYVAKYVQLTCVTTSSNNINAASYKVYTILNESPLRYINLFYFFTLRRMIKRKRITHVIIEHPYFGWLGFLLKKFCSVKVVIHSHNIESIRFKTLNKWWWKVLWYYEKWVYQQAHFVLFITEEDRIYAEHNYELSKNKSAVSTYGVELERKPTQEEKQHAKQLIQKKYALAVDEKIILFNGTLSYGPNLNALEIIINTINPFLQKHQNFKYKILICGKGLPEQISIQQYPNIILCGLVDDIENYFKAADIFINPVIDGGGIKTKIVEALAFNTTVISTKSGAIGIPETIVNDKLLLVNNNDWEKFARLIIETDSSVQTPEKFYNHFYWGNIAQKTYQILQQI